MQKLTMSHLAQQLDSDLTPLNLLRNGTVSEHITRLIGKRARKEQLRPVGRVLVDEGLVSEAEYRLAHTLKQTFYSPQRRRFAVIVPYNDKGRPDVTVVYCEPPKPARFKAAPTFTVKET
jgi:hypothetical protein